MALTINSIGARAVQTLRTATQLQVAAVFERSFYLRSGAAFICVGDRDIGDGPLNALVGDFLVGDYLINDFRRLAINRYPGEPVRSADHTLQFSNGALLSWAEAHIWTMPPWPDQRRVLATATFDLLAHSPADGLFGLCAHLLLDNLQNSTVPGHSYHRPYRVTRVQPPRISLPPPLRGEGRGGGYRATGFVETKYPPPHAARSIFVKYKNRAALSSPSRGGEDEGNRKRLRIGSTVSLIGKTPSSRVPGIRFERSSIRMSGIFTAAGEASVSPTEPVKSPGKGSPEMVAGITPLQSRASPAVLALLKGLAAPSPKPATYLAAAVSGLIGLGPGLTPSGDDVLAGVLLGLHATGRAPLATELGALVAAASLSGTSPLSAAFLRCAIVGETSAALHQVFSAALTNAEWSAALDTIDRIGHTSGWDHLAGFLLALTAVQMRPRT